MVGSMPQPSGELRAKFPGSDDEAMEVLEKNFVYMKRARAWIAGRMAIADADCSLSEDIKSLAALLDSVAKKARLDEARWWHLRFAAGQIDSVAADRIADLEKQS